MSVNPHVRPSLSTLFRTGVGEAKLLLGSTPKFLFPLFITAVWGVVAVTFGLLVGFGAVILPPTGTFAIVALPALLLLWVTPDLQFVPRRQLDFALWLMVTVCIAVPGYYMILVSGLPWVSARRVTEFWLFIILAICLAGSRSVRGQLVDTLKSNLPISVCVIGYFVMVILSIITSINPAASLSIFSDLLFLVFTPFVACLIVINTPGKFRAMFKLIMYLSIVVVILGVIEFVLGKPFLPFLLPQSLLNAILAANPSFTGIINVFGHVQGSQYRSHSIYSVPLSFGEFAAMVAPFGLALGMFGTRFFSDRVFGYIVFVLALVGVLAAGSRGGYASLVIVFSVVPAIAVYRVWKTSPASLMPGFTGVVAALGVGALLVSVVFVPRVHMTVFGGGASAGSTQARWDQWDRAKPIVMTNPITGHGLGSAGDLLGYAETYGSATVDSWPISSLVETGVPGFLFFFGTIFMSIRAGIPYAARPTSLAPYALGLVGALSAFATNRLVLSQERILLYSTLW